jgi:hypothetical protein
MIRSRPQGGGMEEVKTYGDIYKLFCMRNPDMVQVINDYRPAGDNTIRIWVGKSGHTASFTATYVPHTKEFILRKETKEEVDRFYDLDD